jgi:hypothetical protein
LFEISSNFLSFLKKIIIVNRKDCCSDRAKGLQVQLYKEPSTNTSRTIISKVNITTDRPTYAWSLDENGFTDREDSTLDLPWQCVGDISVPLRRNINNDVECMSTNNRDCIWKNNKTDCESLLTNKPNDIKPLSCGDMHKSNYGDTGYEEDQNRMYEWGQTTLINNRARVYKGGNWRDRAYYTIPGTRRFLDERRSMATLGFRCAMTRVGSPTGLGARDTR